MHIMTHFFLALTHYETLCVVIFKEQTEEMESPLINELIRIQQLCKYQHL